MKNKRKFIPYNDNNMACVDSAFKISAWQNYDDLGYCYSISAWSDAVGYDEDGCDGRRHSDLYEYRKILSEILNKKYAN